MAVTKCAKLVRGPFIWMNIDYSPLSCSRPNTTAGILEERLVSDAECLRGQVSNKRQRCVQVSTRPTLSMYSNKMILAHLWNEEWTGEWYCSGQPFIPSPGTSFSVDQASAGDLAMDKARPEDVEALSVAVPSGILSTIDFSLS